MSLIRFVAVAIFCSLLPVGVYAQDDPFNSGPDPFSEGRRRNSATNRPSSRTPPKTQTKAVKKPSTAEKEERLARALTEETSHSFVNLPLSDALQTIAALHKVPILLDRRALEEVGLTPETPVNIGLNNVSLRSFLRLMLRDLELTYMIKDEVIQITTIEAAENNRVLKMYSIPKSLADKADKVLLALQSTVQPDTWDLSGGPSTVVAVDSIMAVSATSDVHDEVEDFLLKLEAAFEKIRSQKR